MVFEKRPIKEFSELLIRIGRIQYLIVSLVLSGYIVFGPAFLYFWAGDMYAESYWIGLLTMLPLAVPLIQSIAFSTIVAKNKHRFRAIVYACVAICNVLTTALAIPRYGIIGAAVCTAFAFVLGNGIIMNLYYYKKIGLDIPEFWRNIIKMTSVPTILVVLSIYIINNIIPITSLYIFMGGVLLYTILFCILSWILTMNEYEKNLIRGIIKKVKGS